MIVERKGLGGKRIYGDTLLLLGGGGEKNNLLDNTHFRSNYLAEKNYWPDKCCFEIRRIQLIHNL